MFGFIGAVISWFVSSVFDVVFYLGENIVGWLLPIYMTIYIVHNKQYSKYNNYICFWCLASIFYLLDYCTFFGLHYIYFYRLFRFCFFLWIQINYCQYSVFLIQYIAPVVDQYRDIMDQALNKFGYQVDTTYSAVVTNTKNRMFDSIRNSNNTVVQSIYNTVDSFLNKNDTDTTTTNNTNTDQNIDRHTNRDVDQSTERSTEKNIDKSTDKNIEQSTDRTIDRNTDRNDRNFDKNIDRNIDRNIDTRTDDRTIDRSIDRNIDRNTDVNTNINNTYTTSNAGTGAGVDVRPDTRTGNFGGVDAVNGVSTVGAGTVAGSVPVTVTTNNNVDNRADTNPTINANITIRPSIHSGVPPVVNTTITRE